jgi:oxaloacetate decarboxylase (Na+ extruding) subunit gamma
MTIPEMLSQSTMLTFLGMGVVFSFLIILIAFMKLVEILVRVSGLGKKDESSSSGSANAGGADASVIAAIASAVNEKKNK